MSFETWQYAFTNGLKEKEQKRLYEKYAAPESKLLTRDGVTDAAKVDFKRPHAPLLIIAGSKDQIIPPALNKKNARKYTHPVDFQRQPFRRQYGVEEIRRLLPRLDQKA